ncbi:hypothetical protein MRS44_005277 [Fusarium solani]|uniref:uncharacterized protein n=1 Tax=Fusarium solani TaxID=169388 RepID=UPI0032C485E3|nr:hypothetical protein MRS44_005277 [Fusarium solani]
MINDQPSCSADSETSRQLVAFLAKRHNVRLNCLDLPHLLQDRVAPEALHEIADVYGKVIDNLQAHTHPDSPYPSASYIKSVTETGPPVYGMDAVGDDIPLSEGGELVLERLTSNPQSSEPLWVIVWGGVNVLAQFLYRIRNRPDAASLRAKLRVYTISDQDDSGAWIRLQYPDVFYICCVHGWCQYDGATWLGVSTPVHGADQTKVTREWLKEHIQIGPLGAVYPTPVFSMEGDTPTFLYLIQNGHRVSEEPSYGSWGGRYLPVNASAKGAPNRGHFADTPDYVTADGKRIRSNHATIWHWRDAFQDDFAARCSIVNGIRGLEPVYLEVDAGSSITLDTSETYDPDRDKLTFKWEQYCEPSATQSYHPFEVSSLEIKLLGDGDGRKVEVSAMPAEKSCIVVRSQKMLEKGPLLHLILSVTDSGTPALTSYRRVLIQPINRDYTGPGDKKPLADEDLFAFAILLQPNAQH